MLQCTIAVHWSGTILEILSSSKQTNTTPFGDTLNIRATLSEQLSIVLLTNTLPCLQNKHHIAKTISNAIDLLCIPQIESEMCVPIKECVPIKDCVSIKECVPIKVRAYTHKSIVVSPESLSVTSLSCASYYVPYIAGH